jgi:hypothetical protein
MSRSNTTEFANPTSACGGRTVLNALGWVSAGLSAVALGVIIGRELRQSYKFRRRTPYDFYAHAGDEMPDFDYGVGV